MSPAARFGARVLLLTAAVVTAAAAEQPVPLEHAAWMNVRLVHFIFGAIGASLMVTTKPLGWGETFATLTAGVGAAIIFTPLALTRLGLAPGAEENAIAALLGMGGLYLMQLIRALFAELARNPMRTFLAVLDRWRGIAPPPDSSTPSQESKP
jgi:hypothetical protein